MEKINKRKFEPHLGTHVTTMNVERILTQDSLDFTKGCESTTAPLSLPFQQETGKDDEFYSLYEKKLWH